MAKKKEERAVSPPYRGEFLISLSSREREPLEDSEFVRARARTRVRVVMNYPWYASALIKPIMGPDR